MTTWTVADWLMLTFFMAGAIGVVLRSQHALITGLLRDKWQEHEKRISATEERQNESDEDMHVIDLRLTKVETVCTMRTQERNP
jgi:hypothetical protein